MKEIGEWSALGLMTGGLVTMALVASAIQEEVCDTALKDAFHCEMARSNAWMCLQSCADVSLLCAA